MHKVSDVDKINATIVLNKTKVKLMTVCVVWLCPMMMWLVQMRDEDLDNEDYVKSQLARSRWKQASKTSISVRVVTSPHYWMIRQKLQKLHGFVVKCCSC